MAHGFEFVKNLKYLAFDKLTDIAGSFLTTYLVILPTTSGSACTSKDIVQNFAKMMLFKIFGQIFYKRFQISKLICFLKVFEIKIDEERAILAKFTKSRL